MTSSAAPDAGADDQDDVRFWLSYKDHRKKVASEVKFYLWMSVGLLAAVSLARWLMWLSLDERPPRTPEWIPAGDDYFGALTFIVVVVLAINAAGHSLPATGENLGTRQLLRFVAQLLGLGMVFSSLLALIGIVFLSPHSDPSTTESVENLFSWQTLFIVFSAIIVVALCADSAARLVREDQTRIIGRQRTKHTKSRLEKARTKWSGARNRRRPWLMIALEGLVVGLAFVGPVALLQATGTGPRWSVLALAVFPIGWLAWTYNWSIDALRGKILERADKYILARVMYSVTALAVLLAGIELVLQEPNAWRAGVFVCALVIVVPVWNQYRLYVSKKGWRQARIVTWLDHQIAICDEELHAEETTKKPVKTPTPWWGRSRRRFRELRLEE